MKTIQYFSQTFTMGFMTPQQFVLEKYMSHGSIIVDRLSDKLTSVKVQLKTVEK